MNCEYKCCILFLQSVVLFSVTMSGRQLKVCNIVAVGRFNGVDFKAIQSDAGRKRKNKKHFNGAIIRLPSLCTCLIFPNGAVTAVGIKSLERITAIAQRLCMVLPSLPECTVECQSELQVCNIVASKSYGMKIDMVKLYDMLKGSCFLMYTPETFPGMKISLSHWNVITASNLVAIIFHSGKVIITGANCMDDVTRGDSIVDDIISRLMTHC